MIQKTGKMIETEQTIVVCDLCKRDTTARMLDGENCIELSGKFSAGFGYYSNRDGEQVSFDMCSDCTTVVENMLRQKWPDLPPVKHYI